ncbi:hypothetical protein [Streptomyces sp. NPDC058653]|uniref:hypothetical protein n=1 Tax=Streptomyces sp. NPDC058653 TaxID=3346576 RepID=UPI00366040C1
MPIAPQDRRASRTAVATLAALGLLALGTAPAALADEPGPHLVLGDIAPVDGARPGGLLGQSVTLVNKGTGAADKVWVSYSVTRGLGFPEVPSNCQTYQIPSYDEMTAKSKVVCRFDQTVGSGAGYAPEKPLPIKVLDRALNDDLRVTVGVGEPVPDENATSPVPGTAPPVKLVERQPAGEATKEAVDVPVTSVNTADYEVTGAALKGAVGDTVTLKVSFANAGPAWVLTREGDPLVQVLITPPAGTSSLKPHGYCQPKGKAYACGTGQRWVDEGGGETYTFKLRIDKKVPGAKGSVALSTDERPFDPDKTNDRADITLDVTGGGPSDTTGGSGSGGASGSSGATGGSDGTAGGSSSTGGGGSTTTGGYLAATGSSSATLPVLGAAGAVVAAGAGLLVVVRRRGQSPS